LSELKDCPFCFSPLKEFPIVMTGRKILPNSHTIECIRCGATGGTGWSKEETIEKWNRRTAAL